jgi:hypothetical protein
MHYGFNHQIEDVREAPCTIWIPWEILKSACKMFNHLVVISRVVAGYGQYLELDQVLRFSFSF